MSPSTIILLFQGRMKTWTPVRERFSQRREVLYSRTPLQAFTRFVVPLVLSANRCQLVAGVGFAPTTFRL